MWFWLRNIQWFGNMSNLLPAVGEKKPGAARCADRHRWARGQGSSSPSFGTSRSTTVPGSETWLPDLSAGAHKNRGNGNGSRAWNLWDVIYEWHVFCVGSVPRKGLVAGDHSLCSFLSAKLMRQLGAEVMPCLVDECLAVWPGGLLWLGASEWLWFKLNLPEKKTWWVWIPLLFFQEFFEPIRTRSNLTNIYSMHHKAVPLSRPLGRSSQNTFKNHAPPLQEENRLLRASLWFWQGKKETCVTWKPVLNDNTFRKPRTTMSGRWNCEYSNCTAET